MRKDPCFTKWCYFYIVFIDAAKELRKLGIGCHIIFLIISREYALEAFQADAVQYLLKPAAQDELFQVLDKVRKKADERKKISGHQDWRKSLPDTNPGHRICRGTEKKPVSVPV